MRNPLTAPGRLIHPPGNSQNLTAISNVLAVGMMTPSTAFTIDAIGINVVTAGSGGPLYADVGVFAHEDGPGRLLAKVKVTGLDTTGLKLVPFGYTFVLPNGPLWVGVLVLPHSVMPVLTGTSSGIWESFDTVAEEASISIQHDHVRYVDMTALPDTLAGLPAVVMANRPTPAVLLRVANAAPNGVRASPDTIAPYVGSRWELPTTIGGKPYQT